MGTSVREIMTERPRAVASGASIGEVVEVMESEDVGAVPIVDPDGRLLGVVTDRDLVLGVLGGGGDCLSEVSLLKLGTEEPISALPDTELDDALALMGKHRIRRLPIIDGDGRLIGVISQADIALAGKTKEVGELLAEVSVPREGPRL